MKKKILIIFGILLISGLSTILMQSCDKDTFCYLDVTVTAPLFDSTGTKVVGYHAPDSCWIVINQEGGTIGDTQMVMMTGTHSYTFSAPAIFTIRAREFVLDTINWKKCYFRQGTKAIRLKEGERVSADVKIDPLRLDARQRKDDESIQDPTRYDFQDYFIVFDN